MTRANEIFIKNLKHYNKREIINMITEFIEEHEKLEEHNKNLLDFVREQSNYVERLEITIKTIMEVNNKWKEQHYKTCRTLHTMN